MGVHPSARGQLAFTASVLAIVVVTLMIGADARYAAGLAKGDVSLTLGAGGKLKLVVGVDAAGVPVATTARIACATSPKAGSGAVASDAAATAHKVVLPGVSTANSRYYYDIVLADFGESGPVYNQEWRDARKMFLPVADPASRQYWSGTPASIPPGGPTSRRVSRSSRPSRASTSSPATCATTCATCRTASRTSPKAAPAHMSGRLRRLRGTSST